MKTEKTAVRPSEDFLSLTFLGMIAGTTILAIVAKSVLVFVGGVVLTLALQRKLVQGFNSTKN